MSAVPGGGSGTGSGADNRFAGGGIGVVDGEVTIAATGTPEQLVAAQPCLRALVLADAGNAASLRVGTLAPTMELAAGESLWLDVADVGMVFVEGTAADKLRWIAEVGHVRQIPWEVAVADENFRAALEAVGVDNMIALTAEDVITLTGTVSGDWRGLRYAAKLEQLDLTNTGVTAPLIEVTSLPLVSLKLSGCTVSGDLSQTPNVPNLITLELEGSGLTGDLARLARATRLTTLVLDGGTHTITGQPFLARGLETLSIVNGGMAASFVDDVLAALVSSLALTGRVVCAVDLTGNTAPTGAGLADAATLTAAGWTVTHD